MPAFCLAAGVWETVRPAMELKDPPEVKEAEERKRRRAAKKAAEAAKAAESADSEPSGTKSEEPVV